MRDEVPGQAPGPEQGQGQAQQEHGAEAGHSPMAAAARAVSALAHGHRPGPAREHAGPDRERKPGTDREHRAARRSRRTADWARRYKVQAMITLVPPQDGATGPALAGPTCRAVIRAQHHDSHAGKFFPALVDIRDDYAVPDASHLIVTAVVLGDDAGDYLSVGDEFALWRGCDIGHGVVTRRVFI